MDEILLFPDNLGRKTNEAGIVATLAGLLTMRGQDINNPGFKQLGLDSGKAVEGDSAYEETSVAPEDLRDFLLSQAIMSGYQGLMETRGYQHLVKNALAPRGAIRTPNWRSRLARCMLRRDYPLAQQRAKLYSAMGNALIYVTYQEEDIVGVNHLFTLTSEELYTSFSEHETLAPFMEMLEKASHHSVKAVCEK